MRLKLPFEASDMVDSEPLDGELALASHWVVIPDDDRPVHFQRHLGDDDPLCEVCGLGIKQPDRIFFSGQQTPKVVICPHCGGDPDRIPKPPKPKRPWVRDTHWDEEPIIWVWGRRFLILLFIFAAIIVFIKESSSSP
jgi:hypothetical protein